MSRKGRMTKVASHSDQDERRGEMKETRVDDSAILDEDDYRTWPSDPQYDGVYDCRSGSPTVAGFEYAMPTHEANNELHFRMMTDPLNNDYYCGLFALRSAKSCLSKNGKTLSATEIADILLKEYKEHYAKKLQHRREKANVVQKLTWALKVVRPPYDDEGQLQSIDLRHAIDLQPSDTWTPLFERKMLLAGADVDGGTRRVKLRLKPAVSDISLPPPCDLKAELGGGDDKTPEQRYDDELAKFKQSVVDDIRGQLVVETANWIDTDSPDCDLAARSMTALASELDYAGKLGAYACVLNLRRCDVPNMADVIQQNQKLHTKLKYWVKVDMVGSVRRTTSDAADKAAEADTWHWWRALHSRLLNHPQVAVCLVINDEARDIVKTDLITRWWGDHVAALWYKMSDYQYDDKLSDRLKLAPFRRTLIETWLGNGGSTVPLICAGAPSDIVAVGHYIPPKELASAWDCVLRDIARHWKNRDEQFRVRGNVSRGSRDSCSDFAQPMTIDVSNDTYDSWETDYIKYQLYYNAIWAQFVKFYNAGKMNPIVMVLGAGQGPLVRLVVRATNTMYNYGPSGRAAKRNESAKTLLERNIVCMTEAVPEPNFEYHRFQPIIYAVDKNTHAMETLHRRNKEEWAKRVLIVKSDMRVFEPEHKADLIISELIGGFGCNELSPECLDPALHLCHENTVSIPYRYQSMVSPVECVNAWQQMRTYDREKRLKAATAAGEVVDNEDCPYYSWWKKDCEEHDPSESVVITAAYNQYQIGESKAVFDFVHPNYAEGGNNRYQVKHVSWIAKSDCQLSGFIGTFTVQLLMNNEDDARFFYALCPEKRTPEMYAWSPVYFPLSEGMTVKAGDRIEARFERCTNEENSRVWYEWTVLEPRPTHTHNKDAKHFVMHVEPMPLDRVRETAAETIGRDDRSDETIGMRR